jgi:hypothetical protein
MRRSRSAKSDRSPRAGRRVESSTDTPYCYLKDVLERLPTHSASRIEELLPHRWQPLPIPNRSVHHFAGDCSLYTLAHVYGAYANCSLIPYDLAVRLRVSQRRGTQ